MSNHGLDVSSYALVGVRWYRTAVIDLLAVVEHEVDHTCVQEDSSWYTLKRRHAQRHAAVDLAAQGQLGIATVGARRSRSSWHFRF